MHAVIFKLMERIRFAACDDAMIKLLCSVILIMRSINRIQSDANSYNMTCLAYLFLSICPLLTTKLI